MGEANKVARKAADDFFAQFIAEQKAKTDAKKKANRDLESQFISDRDSESSKSWGKVTTLIDTQAHPDRKDVARMRGLLLQLKETPPVSAH
eukprot:JP442079.1.p2 GENE.JP442079.1~~JP442079.1.p2  ORF type:complete len:91 (-),score=45.11 JP442079.1:17-289(-)